MAVLGAQVNDQGRVVVPTAIRKQMGIEGPVDVLFRYENGIPTVETIEDAVASVQRIVESYVDGDRLLVDGLIAQRRVDAATEQWRQSTHVPSPHWTAEKQAVPRCWVYAWRQDVVGELFRGPLHTRPRRSTHWEV